MVCRARVHVRAACGMSMSMLVLVFAVAAASAASGDHAVRKLARPQANQQLAAADAAVIPYGDDFVLSPRCGQRSPGAWKPLAADYRLSIYVNFDGARLSQGGNDARTNVTNLLVVPTLDYPAMQWGAYGGREKGIKDVIDELTLLFGDYSVELVTERPATGDYTMAMVGGVGDNIKKGTPGTVGIAPLDCDNSYANDLVVVFGERVSSAKQLAYVIAHELGHSFGLEHVSDKKGIMYPALTGETCCWADSELAQGSGCQRDRQDARKVLLDNLGGGPGDVIAPLVWFVRPGPGAVVPPNFAFEVGAADDLRVHHVDLYVDGKKSLELAGEPYVLPLVGLPDGEHVLRATVFDWKPNEVTIEQRITVDSRCPAQGTCYLGTAGIGQPCQEGDECASGLCAKKDGTGVCAARCTSEGASCPQGTSCQSSDGGRTACTAGPGWALHAAGGGCTVASTRGDATGGADLVWVLALLLGWRRRRRAGSCACPGRRPSSADQPSSRFIAKRMRSRASS